MHTYSVTAKEIFMIHQPVFIQGLRTGLQSTCRTGLLSKLNSYLERGGSRGVIRCVYFAVLQFYNLGKVPTIFEYAYVYVR